MKGLLILLFTFWLLGANAQVATVFDRRHLQIINENGVIREKAEMAYQQFLENIKSNTDDIAVNMGSMALAERIIYRSISGVNEALEDGFQVRQILKLISAVYAQSSAILSLAELSLADNDPVLLLFAEAYARQAREKGIALVNQIASFVLQEGKNMLMSHNVRDELLTEILKNLQEIHGYLLAIKQSMYWAKINGKLKSLNPYQKYVNKDIALVERILWNKKILNR